MTAEIVPLPSRRERAAYAALAGLSEEQRQAIMATRHVVLSLLMAAQGLRAETPANAASVALLADTLDKALCTLMGFKGFAIKDIPAEIGP